MLAIQSHVNYAMLLEKLGLMNGALNVLAVQQYGIAVNALEKFLDTEEEPIADQLRDQYEKRIADINSMAHRLMRRGTANAMTQEEYLKMRRSLTADSTDMQ